MAADSRYITGLAPALVPLDPKDELMIVWERSYILSGGLARFAFVGDDMLMDSDVSLIEDRDFLYPLYSNRDPMSKVLLSWLDSHFREPMWKSKMYRNRELEFKVFIVLIHLSRLEGLLRQMVKKLQGAAVRIV